MSHINWKMRVDNIAVEQQAKVIVDILKNCCAWSIFGFELVTDSTSKSDVKLTSLGYMPKEFRKLLIECLLQDYSDFDEEKE